MKIRFLTLAFILPALLLLSACSSSTPTEDPQAAQAAPAQVIVQGRMEPAYSVDLSFSVPGHVQSVSVVEGELVAEGDLIAVLAGSEARQAELARAEQALLAAQDALDDLAVHAPLAAAQAEAALADARLAVTQAEERLAELEDTDDVSETELEQAQAQLALARALETAAADQAALLEDGVDPKLRSDLEVAVNVAQANLFAAQMALAAYELRAPAAGTLTGLDLKAGEFVAAGQPVGAVADLSTWIVKTDDLTELEVVQVTEGQAVEVILDAVPGSPMTGTVTLIAARYEEKRGDVTYTVTIALDELAQAARWGMTGQVVFDGAE